MSILTGEPLQELLEQLLQAEDSTAAAKLLGKFRTITEVHFESVDWIRLRNTTADRRLVFPRISWGGRSLVFVDCEFGDGDFIFPGTFHGAVAFFNPNFGEGLVSFAGSEFQGLAIQGGCFSGTGSLSFQACSFSGQTKLWIRQLGRKTLDFGRVDDEGERPGQTCTISGGLFLLEIEASGGQHVNFDGAHFSSTSVALNFEGATALSGVGFNSTTWHSQTVDIRNLQLSSKEAQRLAFTNANFEAVRQLIMTNIGMSQGSIIFALAKFPANAIFKLHFGNLGPGVIAFHHASFPGSAEFSQDPESEFLSELSFKGSTFEGPLSLADIRFGPVPDLVGTQFNKHLNLSNIEFGKRLKGKDLRAEKSRALKLQRIKELAEGNRDHKLALDCHAEEMKHRRFRKFTFQNVGADCLDVAYQITSDYGRSIILPVCWLCVVWSSFSWIYQFEFEVIESGRLFSAAWTFPFLPAAGVLRRSNFGDVLSQGDPLLISLIGIQSLFSIALFFLVGLGFRNRFRI